MPTPATTQLRPIPRRRWDRAHAAHLLNRAGFGGNPAEIEALYERGPEEAVSSLVDYPAGRAATPPGWANPEDGPLFGGFRGMRDLPEEERRAKQRELQRENRRRLLGLRTWWLERMRGSPRPLEEKLTLFWHGHFATGFRKVKSAYAMYLQNQTLREHAVGSWGDMLRAVSRDPAMLIYLDGARSRRGAPNENFARELMELFTLGEGHYAEEDIREAARAFTGWIVNRSEGNSAFVGRAHDPGPKEFFGERGAFDGDDIIRILLEQPRAAEYIAERLWSFFAYRDADPELVKALGKHLREENYAFRPFLRTLFLSRAFHGERAYRTQIKSPVQWLVSSVRYLEAPLPSPGVSTYILDTLGQQLFDPPNVAGWEGGEAWITTATLLHRYNLAAFLTKGVSEEQGALAGDVRRTMQRGMAMMMDMNEEMTPRERRQARTAVMQKAARPVMDPDKVLPEDERKDRHTAHQRLQWRMYQSDLRPEDIEAFKDYFEALPEPEGWTDRHLRETVHTLMSTPQFQLT